MSVTPQLAVKFLDLIEKFKLTHEADYLAAEWIVVDEIEPLAKTLAPHVSPGEAKLLMQFVNHLADEDAPYVEAGKLWPELKSSLQVAAMMPVLPSEGEGEALSRMMAMLDDNHARIIAIADNPELDVDTKLRTIATIDQRFTGKTADELATLLKVTAAAVRKTKWWKVDRKAVLGD